MPLLDAHQGQPVALAQNVVAALCGITVHQVQQLDIDDLSMLASDAMWQVEQVCIQMGLPPHFFLLPRAAGEEA
ncbi:hypothetical protein [uncultured Novosphingobium sp.]|uniref:hypothetical protein n=1 Tax=uncultured Novosphingobium sp. TaxID=292277 RepID=UPI0025920A37|nr:hypothetical protein [uncultured Novosphingobium sp.]